MTLKCNTHKEALGFNLQTGLELHHAALNNLWSSYKAPTMSIEQFIAQYEEDIVNDLRPRLSEACIIEKGHITFGITSKKLEPIRTKADIAAGLLQTYETGFTDPLVFGGEVTEDLVGHCIKYSELSKALDWNKSLRELLRFGERIGLDRPQVAKALKLMVSICMTHYYKSLEYLEDPDEIFKASATFIDLQDQKSKIRIAMRNITRAPGDDMAIPLNTIQNLVIEGLQLEKPDADVSKLRKMASKHAIRAVQSLVEPQTYSQVQAFRAQRWKMNGHRCTLDEIVVFINETEMKPKYKLTGVMKLRERHVDWEYEVAHFAVEQDVGAAAMIGGEDSDDDYEDIDEIYAADAEIDGAGDDNGATVSAAGTSNRPVTRKWAKQGMKDITRKPLENKKPTRREKLVKKVR